MPRITEADIRTQRRRRTEEILDAAEHLLSATDGDPVNIAVLARAVGLTRTGVYKYFPSMDAVLEAVVGRHFPVFREAVMNAMEAEFAPQHRIIAYVRANVEQSVINDHAWRAGLSRVGLGDEARRRIAEEHRALTALLRDEVARLVGGDDADEIEDLTAAVQALTDTAVNRIDAGADPVRTEAFFSRLVADVIGDRAGRTPGEPS